MIAVGVNRDFSLAHYPPGANAFEVAYMHRPWPHGYPLQSDDKGRLMKPWIPANLRAPEPLVLDKADAYRLKRNARRRVARAVKRDAERQISPLKSKNPQQLATDADSLTN